MLSMTTGEGHGGKSWEEKSGALPANLTRILIFMALLVFMGTARLVFYERGGGRGEDRKKNFLFYFFVCLRCVCMCECTIY